MTLKSISYLLIIGGAVLLVLSLSADMIGLGSYPGMHWAQLTGAAVGLVAGVVGIFLRLMKTQDKQ